MPSAVTVDLERDPTSVSTARGLVRMVLGAGRGGPAAGAEALDAALLATSEVVTNALRHAEGTISITVRRAPDAITVGVTDGGGAAPSVHEPALDAPSGRGMWLVEQLVERWWVEPHAVGKTVWFEVRS